ncbi:lysophospholipid acyltransferase family protein [Desulfonatronospira sp.]|uniref:lysophospholipid acyltransferase family protein n=1 Tax=Desulfonatronospira sp. TaxID=1962951 RepID=UPI0025C25C5C|nr:lysophospholipid acyltransferase family protein [Desulfonatronospira sp.]
MGHFQGLQPVVRALEMIWARSTIWASGTQLELELAELDPEQNYIFLANHQSHLDTPLILSLFARFKPRFLARDSLFRIPIFGPGMRACGHFPLHRGNRRQSMQDIQLAMQKVAQGESILIFPEGTRNPQGQDFLDFQIGAFLIVLKTGLPVVPLVLDGTNQVHYKGRYYIRPGKVRLRALPPWRVSAEYSLKQRDKLKQDLWSLMHNNFLELKNESE